VTLKTYDFSMQPGIEAFFHCCIAAMGWEYDLNGRVLENGVYA